MARNKAGIERAEVSTETIISMPHGMLGFDEHKQYVLVERRQDEPFKRLQCTGNPDLGFLVVDPLEFFPDYDVELSDLDVRELELDDPCDARLVTTVTIDKDNACMTTNLLGPVVMNIRLLRAKQIVLSDERYGTKHVIVRNICQDTPDEQRQAV